MKKFLFGLLWFALFPLNASAQLIGSADVGGSFTQDADIHVTRPPDIDVVFHDVGFDARSFKGPIYFGVRGGYMFKPSFGLEAEYIHIEAFAQLNDPVPVT